MRKRATKNRPTITLNLSHALPVDELADHISEVVNYCSVNSPDAIFALIVELDRKQEAYDFTERLAKHLLSELKESSDEFVFEDLRP